EFANSSRPGVDRPAGSFGGNNLNRQERGEDRVQSGDNVTWARGAHTMKFCGDLNASDVATYGDDPIPCPGNPGVDDDGDGVIDEPGLIRTYPLFFQFIA